MESEASSPGDPQTASQFWDDFWNTLYQFTHPFSSTFFDSLFSNDDTDSTVPPQPADDTATGSGALHFKDKVNFERFWQGLKSGVYHHESNPSTPLEHIQTAWIDFKSASAEFISSVEWQQTWIQMILALHLTLFVIIILLRDKPNPLAAMFFCTLLLAALGEPLNGVGSRHWQSFANDNYFDTRGVFTTLVWTVPLLVNATLVVMLLLRAVVKLMVKAKRMEAQRIKSKKRK
ncbi:transmembrane protein 18-domain-containing protein [Mortierella sp. GBAus27b]|nr:hypothetical protein BGX31_002142 [Mortierella sp. GBA43]KAI8351563.1 transmembrane protein 18-domain-containing protein [Mortierella sp. GBAus27b]